MSECQGCDMLYGCGQRSLHLCGAGRPMSLHDPAVQLRETLARLRAHMELVVITKELQEMEAYLMRQIELVDLGTWEYEIRKAWSR